MVLIVLNTLAAPCVVSGSGRLAAILLFPPKKCLRLRRFEIDVDSIVASIIARVLLIISTGVDHSFSGIPGGSTGLAALFDPPHFEALSFRHGP